MALFIPYNVERASYAPAFSNLGNVGGAYETLTAGAQDYANRNLLPVSSYLSTQGASALGPSEIDPTVAALLETARNPVNNQLEDYFRQKYMADVTGRLGTRGLLGQGAGEALANQAGRDYAFGRADTALGRRINAANAASGLRTGQVNRGLSMTNAGANQGIGAYGMIGNALQGEGNAYARLAGLQSDVNMGNARNNASLTPSYLSAYGNLANFGLGALGGVYKYLTRGNGVGSLGTGDAAPSDNYTNADAWGGNTGVTDYGAGADTGGGGDWGEGIDWGGNFFARGGRVRPLAAGGGRIGGRGAYDHIRAVLTPGEFVVKRPIAQKAYPALKALNSGHYRHAARDLARVAV